MAELWSANSHKLAKTCRQVIGNTAVSYSMKQFHENPKISWSMFLWRTHHETFIVCTGLNCLPKILWLLFFCGSSSRCRGLVCGVWLWYFDNIDTMRQSAYLVVHPITAFSFGFLLKCTAVGQASKSMTTLAWNNYRWVGARCLPSAGSTVGRFELIFSSDNLWVELFSLFNLS